MKTSLYILIFTFFIFSAFVLAADVLPAPKISVAPPRYYPLDEALYLEGQAAPNSKVELYFEKLNNTNSPIRVTAEANSNGEWFFSEKLELARGEWNVRARAIKNQLTSDWSNPRIIQSVISGFMLGSLKIKYLPIVITLISLFFIAFALIAYYAFRVRKVKQLILEQEMREKTKELEKKLHDQERESIEETVEHNFEEIRKRIMEELGHLDNKCLKNGRLSQDDEGRQEQLLHALRRCEEEIEKKLKDI